MSAYPKAIENLIGVSGVGFSNAKTNSEINSRIISFGYNEARLDELLNLNARTDVKYHEYEVLHGEQLHLTRQLEEKLNAEIGYYVTYRKLASRIFPGEENKGIRSQLGLDEDIKRAFDSIIEQCKQFYDTTVKKPEIMQVFSEFAVTVETFQERLNELERLRQLNQDQEVAKGKAMVARKLRDDLYQELRTAWTNFTTVCRFVFKGNEEYLRMVNVMPFTARTSKSAADQPQGDQTDQPPPETPGQ
jgi:vacuolar-type H+-ATPase subunit I/STV1